VVFVAQRPEPRAVGFKLAYQHARTEPHASVWDFIGRRDVMVIHLTRLNPLDRLISLELAVSQRKWVAGERQNGLYEPVPVRISLERLRESIDWLQRMAGSVRSLVPAERRLELTYEDLSQEPSEMLERTLSFIGVSPRRIAPVTRRQRTFSQREAIENYDQLRASVQRLHPGWDVYFTSD
jgi:LPS sulfotransferase NodH